MKRIYYFAIALMCISLTANAQQHENLRRLKQLRNNPSAIKGESKELYMFPADGYKSINILPDINTYSVFAIHGNYLYAHDGNTIHRYNMETYEVLNTYTKPEDYVSYPSFLTVSPDGTELWAGFTASQNTDDRIYKIDVATGTWEMVASFAANFDLEFWGNKVLVSGLNSDDWSLPASIFLLDTTASANHKKIIEIGGSSAGFGVDGNGNIYYSATTLSQWDSTDVSGAIDGADIVLTIDDATKLSDVPALAYDCEVDHAGNIVFNMNDYTSDKVIAIWNGTAGDGQNFDTLAYCNGDYDWLTMLSTTGDVTLPGDENGVYSISWGRPIAKTTAILPPALTQALNPISAYEDAENTTLYLDDYFENQEEEGVVTYEILSTSFSEVATATMQVSSTLIIDFISAGQTNVTIKASANGASTIETLVVGVQPKIEGDYTVSNFEDLALEEESYWNGSDGSGEYVSGVLAFENDYNEEWGSWSKWAYSNTSDITTPGYINQFSAITGAGFDPISSEGSNYAVSYASSNGSVVKFTDNIARIVEGVFISNATYAALSMKEGDAYTKKFGGETGNDPDYFKLNIWGMKEGTITDTIEFYLADYRFEDNTKDYIVETWQWVELSSLGKVDSLAFGLESTDVGQWGMNTPAYFVADNFYVTTDAAPIVANPIDDVITNVNAADTLISIADVFTDEDNDDALIVKSVKSNSNESLVMATLDGDNLTLSYTADETGEAEIVIEALSNGKTVTETFKVTVNPDVAVPALLANQVNVYPNPTKGMFTINASNISVSIYNMLGALVYENKNYNGESISLENNEAGQYIVRLKNEEQVVTKLIVKN